MADDEKPKLPKKPPIQTVDIAMNQDPKDVHTGVKKLQNKKK